MVDRIVPATTAADVAQIGRALGLHDAAPVVCEPFRQWVIEDRFAGPRPAWELAGAELVADVAPYEEMKLRLLNGSHSAIAYLGCLAGFEHVFEVMAEPDFVAFVRAMMAEVAPTLAVPTDLAAYQASLLARFANPALAHRTSQIAMDGSQKVPQRLLGPIRDRLRAGAPIDRLTPRARRLDPLRERARRAAACRSRWPIRWPARFAAISAAAGQRPGRTGARTFSSSARCSAPICRASSASRPPSPAGSPRCWPAAPARRLPTAFGALFARTAPQLPTNKKN